MELLTQRYRSLSALVLVIVAQLLLLGYQVRNQRDVRLIRVWAVTAITPVAKLLEGARSGVTSLLDNYIILVGVQRENRRLKEELGGLKLEAQRLRAELSRAERADALRIFQTSTPSKTTAARIIGAGTGADSKVVFVDSGTAGGVRTGMAVITPDGLVGRVRAAYPTASQVVLITDPNFAAGVISQRHHVLGTLKGRGSNLCVVDYVRAEERVEEGEWFFTSGDDRVFPRGLPVGPVRGLRKGPVLMEIAVAPSGLQKRLEEVLIVLEGVHQPIPETEPGLEPQPTLLPQPMLPPPPADPAVPGLDAAPSNLATDADRLLDRYREIGEAQGHVFGEGVAGSRPPEFRADPGPQEAPKPPPAQP